MRLLMQSAPLVATLLLALASCLPRGQVLLELSIVRVEEVLLVTHFDVSDDKLLKRIWDGAGEVPFSTEIDRIVPLPGDPLRAVVDGRCRLRIARRGDLVSEVDLDIVELSRSDPGSKDWRPTLATVERAKDAAGL